MGRRLGLLISSTLLGFACTTQQDEARVSGDLLVGPWRPVPFVLTGPIVERIDMVCRTSFPDFPQDTTLVVIDARGAGRIQAHYVGPEGKQASCYDMAVDRNGAVEGGGGGTSTPGVDFATLTPFEMTNEGGMGSAETSILVGRAGVGIASVTIHLRGELPITASLAQGWFMAWRPGPWPEGTTAFGIDSNGQTVGEVAFP